ncbi:MAG TPA: indole-3-glycerol phosphate synthase TrpC [Candidatus Dormibacteraeota bacterium]|nr:indole-3-glycerol phosphate synthase TrpC [Candidatus Dormibacteraeota bacterium]
MDDILERIFARKGERRRAAAVLEPYEKLVERAGSRIASRRNFVAALRDAPGVAVIAEIKRASPSAGIIAEEFDPNAIARSYQRAGADAISVLTEEEHFLGDLRYLDEVRAATQLPLLRKDFLASPYDIAESAAYGADAVLLIVAGLSDHALSDCLKEAERFSLAALVEVHDAPELERAQRLGATIIGVNNRNLHDFTIDLAVGEKLLPHLRSEAIGIAESGMRTANDVARMLRSGARGVLVGEALMRTEEPKAFIDSLRSAAVGRL